MNMNMKTIALKRTFMVALSAGSLLMSSCSDFLDIAPDSIYASDNLYQTTDQAERTLLGVYSTLCSSNLYGRNITMYYDLDTDLGMIRYASGDPADDGERRSTAHSLFTSTTKNLSNTWNTLYTGVERANILIESIPQMAQYNNGTEEEKFLLRQYLGEGLTLRALFYFDLIRLWGDVPYKTKSSVSGDNFDLPRTSRDTIYKHIINDLQTAIDMVPWANDTRYGNTYHERISKGAVKGFLARICLYAAGYSLRWDLENPTPASRRMARINDENRIRELYTIARDQCHEIMMSGVHKLTPSYEDIWVKYIGGYLMNNTERENIFELGFFSTLSTANEAGYYGTYIGPESKADPCPATGQCSGGVFVTPALQLAFTPGDTRRDITCAYMKHTKESEIKGAFRDISNTYAGKWRNIWGKNESGSCSNFNFPMLRYADVLLMFAEADSYLANGPTSEAIAALKEVRKRAFPETTTSSTEKTKADIDAETYSDYDFAGFLDVIIEERGYELAFEGFRKTDLIRWNKLKERLEWAAGEHEALDQYMENGGTSPYMGQIPHRRGTILNKNMYYRENSKSVIYETKTAEETPVVGENETPWKSRGFLKAPGGVHSNTGNFMHYARGFQENYSELFPIPKAVLDVTTALTQIPGYE